VVNDGFMIASDKETGEDPIEGKQRLLYHQYQIIIREAKINGITNILINVVDFDEK
jgi:hypothetical protein